MKNKQKRKRINISRHAIERAMGRGINHEQIRICVLYGEKIYCTGKVFYFMSAKCLRKVRKIFGAYLDRLEGLVVLANHTPRTIDVVTVYKDKQAIRVIKKKKNYKQKEKTLCKV